MATNVNESDIHPQLLADCHVIAAMPAGLLLLHRNAALPWFILVPDTTETDLLFLDTDLRNAIMADAERVARYLREHFDSTKVNVAALGNQVPQLHLHVVGRCVGDACWPKPVWGNLMEVCEWTDSQLAEIRGAFS